MATNDFDDQKINIDFTDYWLIIRKRFMLILFIFLAVLIGTSIFTAKQLPEFQSVCKIKISARQPMATIEGAQVTWYGSKGNEINNEIKLIANKTEILTAVIDILNRRDKSKLLENSDEDFNFYTSKEIDTLKSLHFSQKDEAYINSLTVDTLRNQLDIQPMLLSSFVEIKATGPQPNVTKAICNVLAIVYKADFWRGQTREARKTRDFIKRQLDKITMELENNKKVVEKTIEEKTFLGSGEVYAQELTNLRLQLDKLQEVYQDIHPKIIKQKNLIATLELQLAKFPKTKQAYDNSIADWESKQRSRKTLSEHMIAAEINYQAKRQQAKDEIQIIAEARGAKKLSPNVPMNITAGILLGVILGCLVAFIWEGLDTSIGKIEDVERITKLPVIAHIPLIGQKYSSMSFSLFSPILILLRLPFKIVVLLFPFLKREKPVNFENKLVFNLKPLSVESEAYRTLRTNIHFAIGGGSASKNSVIAITSTSPREGKTLTATNLAIEIAQMGKMAILLEGDMRKPQIASMFKIDSKPGLSDLLLGTSTRSNAVRTLTDILMGNDDWDKFTETQGLDNLHILPCGTIPPNPTELLLSDEFRNLINELKQEYDFVIIDTPPSLPVSDSSIISTVSDGTVLVYQSDTTSRHLLLRAIQMLRKNRVKLLGIVINQLSFDVILKSSKTKYSYGEKEYDN